jgi:MFS transporter, DHA1 family, inner membrane transport protein
MTSVKQSYQGSTGKLLLLALALFVAATNAFVIAGLLPDIATALGTTPSGVSYSITSYALVVAVASPLVSIFLARVSRTLLMTTGLAVFALGTAVATAGDTLPLFFVGRSLSGLGAAALVPTATAAAAALAAPERRGRALALVGAGFTLATAVGAPLGTALGGAAGWQLPLWILVAAGVALAAVLPFAVRGVPISPPVPLRQRLAPLADRRILAPLGTTLLMVAAFNVVYIFSASITEPATGGSSALLAALLLAYGLTGVVGNLVAGPASDRFGSRPVAVLAIAGQCAALVALTVVERSYIGSVVVFAVWGVAAFAMTIPVQHRLVAVAPEAAGISLSWFSTAMYLGISLAPPLGAGALAVGGPAALPIAGAVASAGALAVFLGGFARRRPVAEPAPAVPEPAATGR